MVTRLARESFHRQTVHAALISSHSCRKSRSGDSATRADLPDKPLICCAIDLSDSALCGLSSPLLGNAANRHGRFTVFTGPGSHPRQDLNSLNGESGGSSVGRSRCHAATSCGERDVRLSAKRQLEHRTISRGRPHPAVSAERAASPPACAGCAGCDSDRNKHENEGNMHIGRKKWPIIGIRTQLAGSTKPEHDQQEKTAELTINLLTLQTRRFEGRQNQWMDLSPEIRKVISRFYDIRRAASNFPALPSTHT